MGKNKQSKDEAPNPNNVANREIFHRLNFLYQASAYLKGIDAQASVPHNDTEEHPRKIYTRKKGGKRRKASLGELGSSYVQCMRTIGNKSVTRMDPNVKRMLCKGCDTVLVPGTTASVRVKGSPDRGHKVVYSCFSCHTSRAIPAPPTAPSFTPVPSSTSPTVLTSTASLQNTLEALETPAAGSSSRDQMSLDRSKKRKRPMPHPLPLFARPDARHVIFRGNEILSESR